MFVATTPPAPAVALSPVTIDGTSSPSLLSPQRTSLRIGWREMNVLEGGQAGVSGVLVTSARHGLGGQVVSLQTQRGRRWVTISRARTRANGHFQLRYRPWRLGSEAVRVDYAGAPFTLASYRRVGPLNVYRLAGASWYGGGGTTACGGALTSSTLGVANKTLPCGTMVTLRYGSHSVQVPVIDRGPYVAGREFDLTEATKAALGFGDTGMVWSTR